MEMDQTELRSLELYPDISLKNHVYNINTIFVQCFQVGRSAAPLNLGTFEIMLFTSIFKIN